MKRKVLKPNVIGGGQAIPMGDNFYYMRGRKHTQGGIDIGANPKTGLEVEDGEVMHLTNKDIKVYSSVPFLNGKSPAQKVIRGENPTKVFNEQERYKKRKGINDDGSKKKQIGGKNTVDDNTDENYEYATESEKNKYNSRQLSIINRHRRSVATFKKRSKDAAKTKIENRKKASDNFFGSINRGMDTLQNTVNSQIETSKQLGNDIKTAADNKREQQLDKWYDYKNGIESTLTAAEIMSAGYGLGRPFSKRLGFKIGNTKLGRFLQNVDKGQLSMNSIGGTADLGQWIIADNSFDKLENGIESIANGVGIAGALNRLPARYDSIADAIGYGIAGYDLAKGAFSGITGKPYQEFFNLTNKKAMGGKTNNELSLIRRQYRTGGLYSLTVDGETKMRQFPTGDRTKAKYGTTKKIVNQQFIKDDAERRIDEWLTGKRAFIWKDNGRVKSVVKPIVKSTINNTIKQVANTKSNVPAVKTTTPTRKHNRKSTKKVQSKPTPLATIGIKPLHDFKAEFAKLPETKLNIPDLSEVKPVDVPVYKKESWLKRTMNKLGVEPNDVASLIPNIAGSLITHSINSRMLNTFKEPQAPIARQAVKLKTRINIEPQLDKMRENLAEYERQVDNNTASSNVALARKNNFRLANIMNTNAIYADKENKETALINQDRLNRQSVIDANVREYNEYLARRNQYQNTIAEKKAENSVGLINNINAGIQNMLSNIDRRKAENRNIAAMAFAHPDLPIELFYKAGIVSKEVGDWDRAGIGRNRRGIKNTI